ncbi:MAG TPA: hypothetical protein VF223_07815, partial [Trebonia sp.]
NEHDSWPGGRAAGPVIVCRVSVCLAASGRAVRPGCLLATVIPVITAAFWSGLTTGHYAITRECSTPRRFLLYFERAATGSRGEGTVTTDAGSVARHLAGHPAFADLRPSEF